MKKLIEQDTKRLKKKLNKFLKEKARYNRTGSSVSNKYACYDGWLLLSQRALYEKVFISISFDAYVISLIF